MTVDRPSERLLAVFRDRTPRDVRRARDRAVARSEFSTKEILGDIAERTRRRYSR